MDIVGGKAKMIQIPVPVGKKILGTIQELKLSTKYENYIDIKIVFPQYKAMSDDGRKEFTKQAFYGIPVDWSEKNKAGKLLFALYGKFPSQESVNWSKALLNKEVACIFEDVFDDETGEPKGQKIKWIGKPGSSPDVDVPEIQVNESELKPDDEVPF